MFAKINWYKNILNSGFALRLIRISDRMRPRRKEGVGAHHTPPILAVTSTCLTTRASTLTAIFATRHITSRSTVDHRLVASDRHSCLRADVSPLTSQPHALWVPPFGRKLAAQPSDLVPCAPRVHCKRTRVSGKGHGKGVPTSRRKTWARGK